MFLGYIFVKFARLVYFKKCKENVLLFVTFPFFFKHVFHFRLTTLEEGWKVLASVMGKSWNDCGHF